MTKGRPLADECSLCGQAFAVSTATPTPKGLSPLKPPTPQKRAEKPSVDCRLENRRLGWSRIQIAIAIYLFQSRINCLNIFFEAHCNQPFLPKVYIHYFYTP